MRAIFIFLLICIGISSPVKADQPALYTGEAGGWNIRGVRMPDETLACFMNRGQGGNLRTLIVAIRENPISMAFIVMAPSQMPSSSGIITFEERTNGSLGAPLPTRVENGVVAIEIDMMTLAALREARDAGRPSITLRVVSPRGAIQNVDVPVEGMPEAFEEQRNCITAVLNTSPGNHQR